MEDKVSIITPSFNSSKFIVETIQSVQNQTHKNWEMIIIDDASTDETEAIVRSIIEKDNRIQFHKLSQNSGAGIARNYAVKKASGRYIAFLDSDDVWKAQKLEKQIKFIINHNLPMTFSFYECMDEDGNLLYTEVQAPKRLSYKQLFFCNYIGNLTGIYDTFFYGKIPISSIKKRQDWILWLTALKKIKTVKPVPESLAFYRVRKDSISASKLNLIKYNYSIYKDFHRKSGVTAFLCMGVFLFTQIFIKPLYVKKIKA